MSSPLNGRSDAADDAERAFPYGRCGDSVQLSDGCGCGAALDPSNEENGVCNTYPDCVLP